MTGSSSWWPLADLRIVGQDITLRPLTEADLAPLAERLPADVEFDPALPAYDGVDARWPFAVLTDDEVVGVQSLEGKDFARRRTVETWSFLLPAARGRGFGKSMRRAVLALAFDHLGALAAETEAL